MHHSVDSRQEINQMIHHVLENESILELQQILIITRNTSNVYESNFILKNFELLFVEKSSRYFYLFTWTKNWLMNLNVVQILILNSFISYLKYVVIYNC